MKKQQKRKKSFYERFVKRPLDFILSLCAIIARDGNHCIAGEKKIGKSGVIHTTTARKR